MLNKSFVQFVCAATVLVVIVLASFTEAATIDAAYRVPKSPPTARYKIDCSIDPAKGLLEGTEVIRFRNTTSSPIHRLAMTWIPNSTLEIKSNGKPVSFLTGVNSSPVVFALPQPIGPGGNVELDVKFSLSAPVPPQGTFKTAMSDWYPRLWWGFETHSDFDVRIEAPAEYTVAASGLLDKKTDYYHAEQIRSFGLFIGRGFNVIEANAEGVLVRCIFSPKAEKCARLLLDTAIDVINFYRQRFGFYPYSYLTIVPGMDRPAGGYPVATGIVAIHGMEKMDKKPELHWRWITAHEIGHQYWSEYVIEKDKPDWLWIGLGIYADREYTRARKLGQDKHRGLMNRYIEGVREGLDTTINRSQEELNQIKFDFNNVVIHGKGYSVISALDCVLGETVFDRIYRRCLKEFGGRRLGVHEFRAVCEEESGRDLGWFFDQWVNSNKCLSYEISSKKCEKKGDKYISEVEVKCLGDLKMPVPVAVYFEDGTYQTKFTDRLLDTNILVFESKAPLKEVRLDPDGALALVVPPPQSLVEKQLIRKMRSVPLVGAGKQALELFNEVGRSKLSDADAWFSLGLALYDGKYYSEAMEAFRSACQLGEKEPYRVSVSLVWQGHILDLLGRREEAVQCYKKALKYKKQGNWVRHDQYGIVINREWVEERLKNPFQRK